jgi:hypothetical protein
MWIILLTALSGVFIYGYLTVLFFSDTLLKVVTILTLPPILAFYPSTNAMRGYFQEKRIRRLVAVAVFLGLLVSLPLTTYAVFRQDWSLRISSERLVYRLGENVTVTATITNNALLTQSVKDMGWGIGFEVRNASRALVCDEFVSFEFDIPIGPGASLERSFTWTSPSTVGNYSISADVSLYYYTPYFHSNLTVTISP